MIKIATDNAMSAYKKVNEETHLFNTPETEQMAFMVMAELCVRQKNKEAAIQYLSSAFRAETNNRVYKDRSRRRYEQIKDGEIEF